MTDQPATDPELRRQLAAAIRALGASETQLARVRTELDRITQLPIVANNSDRADSFDCGARWTIRLIRTALNAPEPAATEATEPATCCVCGGGPVVYRNYREQPFCWPCADCRCNQVLCVRTGINDPAVSSTAAADNPAPVMLRDPCPRCEGSPTLIPRHATP